MKKPAWEQMEIPVPPSPNAKASLDEDDRVRAYRELMGNQAAERQWLLARERETCSCDRPEQRRPELHRSTCRIFRLPKSGGAFPKPRT